MSAEWEEIIVGAGSPRLQSEAVTSPKRNAAERGAETTPLQKTRNSRQPTIRKWFVRYDSFRHHRRSIRMAGYDYSWAGAYFVTICTQHRQQLLGDVTQGKMTLNQSGQMVVDCWQTISHHFDGVSLDEFVVMPNHCHGIIWIVGAGSPRPDSGLAPSSEQHAAEGGAETAPLQRPNLGQIIAYFKYRSTKQINDLQNTIGQQFWQRNYHERIIRNDEELSRIRQYIQDNPKNWDQDPDNVRL